MTVNAIRINCKSMPWMLCVLRSPHKKSIITYRCQLDRCTRRTRCSRQQLLDALHQRKNTICEHLIIVVVVVVVFISTVQHQLVSTAINVYNIDIMES